jgi:pSer/pThr/pTyr-binding forkhead associated (FHA) protein
MYKLVICDDEGKTTIVPLIRDEVSIGRKEGNTIRLTERNISRHHAKVSRQEDSFVIEDLGSFCGTKVNNEVIKDAHREISSGDQITIGDYSLSIRTDVSGDVPLGRQMNPGDEAGIGKVTPHARLVLLSKPEPGREIDLMAELYVVGRSEEANCQIKHPALSRAHARLDLEAGKWTISDLDSVSGIEINGLKKDDYVLKAGDVIGMGAIQLRFVAPGEPYEFNAVRPDTPSSEPVARPKLPKMLWVLGGVAAAAILAIILGLVVFGGQGTKTGDDGTSDADLQTYEGLMEAGKDKMQTEQWGEAAGLFAKAEQKRPGNEQARNMKQLAIEESDAQATHNAGLAAGENKNWKEAVSRLSQIPRSSHYYDLDELKRFSKKLCGELIIKAQFTADNGDYVESEKVLREIDDIPEPSTRCTKQRNRLWKRIRGKLPVDGGMIEMKDFELPRHDAQGGERNKPRDVPGNPYGQPTETKKVEPPAAPKAPSGKSVKNPYASRGKSREANPLSEARKATRAGDNALAAKILEKSGSSRPVLDQLARVYSKTGNRAGYERTARKFIKLYPQDPASQRYSEYLSR